MACQEFLSKQAKSGGDGADAGEDGDPTNAIHPFEFMSGSLPTMLWEDGIALLGGDENGGGGDAIIPDSQPGSGSSVPGGPGVLSIQERTGTVIKPPPKVKKERKGRQAKKGQEDFGEVRAGAEMLVAKMSQAVDHELRRGATEVGDEKMARLESLTDKTRSLKAKIKDAEAESDEDAKASYVALLRVTETTRKKVLAEVLENAAAESEVEEAAAAAVTRAGKAGKGKKRMEKNSTAVRNGGPSAPVVVDEVGVARGAAACPSASSESETAGGGGGGPSTPAVT